MENFTRRGMLAGIVSAALYSVVGVFSKLLTNRIGPEMITLIRDAFVCSISLLLTPCLGFKLLDYDRKSYLILLLMGVFNLLNQLFQHKAFQDINVADACTIIACTPIFVSFTDMISKRKCLTISEFVMIVSCTIGIVLCSQPDFIFNPSAVSWGSKSIANGYVFALVVAILKGPIFCMCKYIDSVDSMTFMIIENAFGMIFLFAYVPSVGKFHVALDVVTDYLFLIGLNVSSILGIYLFYVSNRLESALMTSILRATEVPCGILFTAILFNGSYNWLNVLGSFLVVFSTLLPKLIKLKDQKSGHLELDGN